MSRWVITGGTGTLGQALVKRLGQRDIVVLSRDEFKQAQMAEVYPDVRYFLGDVRDRARLELAFRGAEVVIHTAALKRVDSISYNPDEVLKTNVLGTRNVLHAAHAQRVQKVLVISSDKACYPVNVYGVSKAMAEHLTTSFNVYSFADGTASSVLRYGNVLSSRGSVLPVWRAQAGRALPLTVTDSSMTRFLITVEDAVDYVLAALYRLEGGEIFFPPRMRRAKMVDLAKAVWIDKNGLNAKDDVDGIVHVTGLRVGGEKLHETIYTDVEARTLMDHDALAEIRPSPHPWRSDKWRGTRYIRLPNAVSNSSPLLSIKELVELLGKVPHVHHR